MSEVLEFITIYIWNERDRDKNKTRVHDEWKKLHAAGVVYEPDDGCYILYENVSAYYFYFYFFFKF